MIRFATTHIETALSDPVPAATYACQYWVVAKSAARRGSGRNRIIDHTLFTLYLPSVAPGRSPGSLWFQSGLGVGFFCITDLSCPICCLSSLCF